MKNSNHNNEITTSSGTGEVGTIYSTENGRHLAEESDENVGWRQVSPSKRVKVHYKCFSHATHFWVEVKNENE